MTEMRKNGVAENKINIGKIDVSNVSFKNDVDILLYTAR